MPHGRCRAAKGYLAHKIALMSKFRSQLAEIDGLRAAKLARWEACVQAVALWLSLSARHEKICFFFFLPRPSFEYN